MGIYTQRAIPTKLVELCELKSPLILTILFELFISHYKSFRAKLYWT